MFNLKLIQRTILISAVVIFLTSFVLMLYYSLSSPNGFLANSLGSKPITILTNTKVITKSYGDTISLAEDAKIIDSTTTIVSKTLDATFTTNTQLKLSGLIYIKNTDAINISLSSTVNIDLTPGDYFVSSNPIKVHVLSGVATYNQAKIATANQVAVWQVDTFKTSTLNTDDFVLSKNYSDLVTLLKGINLLPTQLTNLSFDVSSITDAVIQVNDTIDLNANAGCDSSILTQHLLCDINKYRVENGLNELSFDDELNQLTLSHVVWMDDNQSTSTLESNGLSYLERCSNVGLECNAEINIKMNDLNELNVYNQVILNSNILNKDVALIGMNVAGNYLSILTR